MVGDESGFRPNDTITRAEFAKIAIVMMGLGKTAESSKGYSNFPDVPSDHWASGYINIAASQGIIKGDPTGTFRPEDKISNAETLTILLRILGYGQFIQDSHWPVGYIAKATELGITDGVDINGDDNSLRGVTAQLCSNVLTIPLMIQTGFGTGSKWVISGTQDTDEQTILDKYLKINAYDVHVEQIDKQENSMVLKAADPEDKNHDGTVTKYEEDYYLEHYDDFQDGSKYYALDYLQLDGLEDAYITVWVNQDDKIINISDDKDTFVFYDYIAEINGDTEGELEVSTSNDSKKATSIQLRNNNRELNFSDLVQYDGKTFNDNKDTQITLGDMKVDGKYPFSHFGKFIIRKSEIVRYELIDLNYAEGMITKVESDSISYYVKDSSVNNIYDDFTNDDVSSFVVIIDGKRSTIDHLKKGMFFTVSAPYELKGNNTEIILFASSKTIQGKVNKTRLSEEGFQVGIEDHYYTLENTVFYSDNNNYFTQKISVNETANGYVENDDMQLFDDLYDSEITLVLNGDGKVIYVMNKHDGPASQFYGIALDTSSQGDDKVKIGYSKDGSFKEKWYAIESNAKYVALNGTRSDLDLHDIKTLSKSSTLTHQYGVYKFSLSSNGEISRVYEANMEFDGNAQTIMSIDENRDKIKTFIAEDSTVTKNYDVSSADMFDIEDKLNSDDDIKALDWNYVSVSDDDRVRNTLKAVVFTDSDDDKRARYILFTENTNTLGELPVIGFITESPVALNQNQVSLAINDGDQIATLLADKDDNRNIKKNSIILFNRFNNNTCEVFRSGSNYITYENLVAYATHDTTVSQTVYQSVYQYMGGVLETLSPGSDMDGMLTAAINGTVKTVKSRSIVLDSATASAAGDDPSEMAYEIGNSETDSFEFADNIIAYEVKDNNEFKKSTTSAISKGDKVTFIIVDDEIKVIFFTK